jgi:hypothetical protein
MIIFFIAFLQESGRFSIAGPTSISTIFQTRDLVWQQEKNTVSDNDHKSPDCCWYGCWNHQPSHETCPHQRGTESGDNNNNNNRRTVSLKILGK